MIRILLLMAIAAMSASNFNWNGAIDTAQPVVKGTTAAYTKGFQLSGAEDIRVSILVNDTAIAGFGSDSVALHWGYQTFTLGMTDAGLLDTILEPVYIVDTMATTQYAAGLTITKYGTDNITPTVPRKLSDTTMFNGYASQSRCIKPVFNTFIRFYLAGISAVNRSHSNLKVRVVVTQKVGLNTRAK